MTDWPRHTVIELREALKRRALPQAGRKVDLIARLIHHDEQAQAAEVEEDAPPPENEAVAEPEPSKALEATADTQVGESQTKDEPAEDDQTDAPPVDTKADEIPTNEAPQDALDSQDAQHESAPVNAPIEEFTAKETSIELANGESVTEQLGQPERSDDSMHDAAAEKKNDDDASSNREDITMQASPDSLAETQKRKRRSLSPPPTEEAVARKRARAEAPTPNSDIAPAPMDEVEMSQDRPTLDAMDIDEHRDATSSELPQQERHQHHELSPREEEYNQTMEYERDAASPSVHPATRALYVKHLKRPLRPAEFQAHLIDLATPQGDAIDDGVLTKFFLDQIRTHAFIVFKTTFAASRVRASLHDRVWPNEGIREALWVDYVPPEKVQQWIDMEENAGRRSGARWEVVYDVGPDGVEARLESGNSAPRGPPPHGRVPLGPATDSIPTGPRNFREMANQAPSGPRAVRPGIGPGPRPPGASWPGDKQLTKARPVVEYQRASEDVAERRTENIHSFYTKDADRAPGREINRYSFEDGDSFVDRGKEVFEGIRPPHRERAVQMERRGGRGQWRGGRGPFRPRSDRYLPGFNAERDSMDNGRGDFPGHGRQGGGRRDR